MNVEGQGVGGGTGIVQKPGVPTMIERETLLRQRNGGKKERDYNS